MLNNLNIAGLSEYANEVKENNIEGKASYGVVLDWISGQKQKSKRRI